MKKILCYLISLGIFLGGNFMAYQYNPVNGYLDANVFPNPTTEEEHRQQANALPMQALDFINDLDIKKVSKDELTNQRKLDENGNFTGTINGLNPIEIDPYVSAKVAQHDAQLANMANYRQKNNEVSPNMIAGYEGNDVASDLYACTISGGGTLGRENIIGGDDSTVGTDTPNVANLLGTNANYSVIGGGYDNVANGLASILHGFHNVIKQFVTHGTISGGSFHKILSGNYGTIGGGTLHQLTGNNATIAGGNTNKTLANNATVGGGIANEAGGDSSTVSGGYANKVLSGVGASINGGSNNTVSGNYATINGGYNNTINNGRGSIIGGDNNSVNADWGTVLGGSSNNASGKYSTVQGLEGKSNFAGQQVLANGKFATIGDAQLSNVVIKAKTTNATQTNLTTSEGLSPVLQINESVAFTVTVIARRTDVVGEEKYFEIKGMAHKNGGGNVTIITATPVTLGTPAWTIDLVGGSTTFNVKATGEAGKTIQWVAKVEFIENIG